MLDRKLAKCSSATRGVWLELIIAMHQDGRSGELRETVDHLAILARTSTAIVSQALTELQTTGTADVTFRNEIVTVVNRKMKREAKAKTGTALRVKKHRSNKNVTQGVTVQSKRVESKEERDIPLPPFRTFHAPSFQQVHESFVQAGGSKEQAEAFFGKYEAVGWLIQGSEIGNFTSLIPSYLRNWKKNNGQQPETPQIGYRKPNPTY